MLANELSLDAQQLSGSVMLDSILYVGKVVWSCEGVGLTPDLYLPLNDMHLNSVG